MWFVSDVVAGLCGLNPSRMDKGILKAEIWPYCKSLMDGFRTH